MRVSVALEWNCRSPRLAAAGGMTKLRVALSLRVEIRIERVRDWSGHGPLVHHRRLCLSPVAAAVVSATFPCCHPHRGEPGFPAAWHSPTSTCAAFSKESRMKFANAPRVRQEIRGSVVEGPAVQRTSRGNVFRQPVAERTCCFLNGGGVF
jgi:hypothetical protein